MEFQGFNPEWIGMVAGTLTTCAFLPQVYRTVRTKSTQDLSWSWLFMFLTGVFLWLVFGVLTGSISVSVANAVTLVCVLILVAMKWHCEGAPIKSSSSDDFGGRHWGCIGCGQCHNECPMVYGSWQEKRRSVGNKTEPQHKIKNGSDNR